MKKFKNRGNTLIISKENNKEYWISRSVAILVVLIFRDDKTGEKYILLEKRSEKMEEPNRWCCPCGYLDWDEDGWDCSVREVYEETDIYIPDNENKIIFDNNKRPFYINTKPNTERQNIALSYGIYFNGFINVNDKKCDELTEILFANVKNISDYDIAFNQQKRVELFLKMIENK